MDDLPAEDTDVLVVGAGPTGLLAALVLARRGVRAVVVDGKSGPTTESRALAVQARTVEVYDQLGLADEFLARAHRAARVQIGPPGRPVVVDLAAAQEGRPRSPGCTSWSRAAPRTSSSARSARPAARSAGTTPSSTSTTGRPSPTAASARSSTVRTG